MALRDLAEAGDILFQPFPGNEQVIIKRAVNMPGDRGLAAGEGILVADIEHPRIDKYIDSFTSKPNYINLLSERAQPFLFHLMKQY